MDSPSESEDGLYTVFDATLRLCNGCERLLRATSISTRTASNKVTFNSVKNAAAEGCVFCCDIVENVRIRGTSSSIPHDTDLLLQSDLLCFVEGSPSIEMRLGHPDTPRMNIALGTAYYSTVCEDDIDGQIPENMPCFTGSRTTMDLVQSWYNTCLKSHDENTTTDTWYPKRLLEIVSDAKIRLIDTEYRTDLPHGGYASLSHCWGSVETLSLTKGTEHILFGGLDIAMLPLTFREALCVTVQLGIRFLWIDRLCIYQDSVEDWEKQGLTMKDVYRNARVTLAATGAKDSTEGLFHQRKGPERRLLLIPCDPWDNGRRHFLWRGDIHGILVDQPLSGRAWAFQERILSPRTLHFGSQEVAWECEMTFACESFRKAMPPKRPNSGIISEPILSDVSDFYAATWTYMTWTHWYGLVSRYASTDLTFESDRLIAFAGVVQMILERTSSYTYHAGIWADSDFGSVPAQLLWIVPRDVSRRCRSRVPSWSPFFYEKPKKLQYMGLTPGQDLQPLVSIHRLQVHLTDPTQPAGNILSGKLELYGIVRKATIVVISNPGVDGFPYYRYVKVDGIGIDLIKCTLDRGDLSIPGATDVYLIPLVFAPNISTYGLVLQKTENEPEFRRLGLWSIDAGGKETAIALGQITTRRRQGTDHVKIDEIDHPIVDGENAIIRKSQKAFREENPTVDWEDVPPTTFTIV